MFAIAYNLTLTFKEFVVLLNVTCYANRGHRTKTSMQTEERKNAIFWHQHKLEPLCHHGKLPDILDSDMIG